MQNAQTLVMQYLEAFNDTDADAHHNQARFQWHAGPADAPDRYVGFDVILAEDGRIRNVYGFMDAAPVA